MRSPQVLGERIALYKKVREANGMRFDPMQVVVARQLYIGKDKADIEAARARQNANVQRTIAASRTPDGKGAQAGAHVLAYADKGRARPKSMRFTARRPDRRSTRRAPQRRRRTTSCSTCRAASSSSAASRAS